MWWRIVIMFLASLLISAHFMRYGQTPFAVGFACVPLLLFIPKNWATRIVQLTLGISAVLVWGITTYDYIQIRLATGEPWLKLSLIMSSVIIFTCLAALCGNGIIQKRKNRNPYS